MIQHFLRSGFPMCEEPEEEDLNQLATTGITDGGEPENQRPSARTTCAGQRIATGQTW